MVRKRHGRDRYRGQQKSRRINWSNWRGWSIISKRRTQLIVLGSRSRHCYYLLHKKLFLGRSPCINTGTKVMWPESEDFKGVALTAFNEQGPYAAYEACYECCNQLEQRENVWSRPRVRRWVHGWRLLVLLMTYILHRPVKPWDFNKFICGYGMSLVTLSTLPQSQYGCGRLFRTLERGMTLYYI